MIVSANDDHNPCDDLIDGESLVAEAPSQLSSLCGHLCAPVPNYDITKKGIDKDRLKPTKEVPFPVLFSPELIDPFDHKITSQDVKVNQCGEPIGGEAFKPNPIFISLPKHPKPPWCDDHDPSSDPFTPV